MKSTNPTQGQYRNRASFGKRREYIAIAELLRLGCDVYTTLVDDQQIDCVIRRGDHDYIDLQIKASSKICQPKDAGRFASMKIPNPRDKYFFLFYCEHINTYWVFPSMDLVKKASKSKTGSDKGKYTINLTGIKKGKVYAKKEYSEYKGNFKPLTPNT
ncbi:MAG: hypothetical protein MJE68_26420 [Proteobacteria bacterium]|nr:hypothetical protein [Pseudomonadota bacterium]